MVVVAGEDPDQAMRDGVQVGVGFVQTTHPIDDALLVGVAGVGEDLPV